MGDVEAFVDEHSDAELLPSGKVLCTVTQHELPANLDLVLAHWSGKKYATKKAQSKYDFSKHEPWIIPNRKSPDLLFCTLTRQAVSRQPKTVEGHVNGKKYKRLLAEAQAPSKASKNKKQGASTKGGAISADVAAKSTKGASRAGDSEDEDEDEDDDDEAESDQDDSEEEDDAAEFLREGAFWESGSDVEASGDEDGAAGQAAPKHHGKAAANKKRQVITLEGGKAPKKRKQQEDDEDAFWVRGSTSVGDLPSDEEDEAASKPTKKRTAASASTNGGKKPKASSKKRVDGIAISKAKGSKPGRS
jgi:hypothetical protein